MATDKPPRSGYGYIYILGNESMPGIYKVGLTENSLDQRIRELGSTGVPTPFRAAKIFEVEKRHLRSVEGAIHRRLKDLHAHHGKEFFKITLQKCVTVSEDVILEITGRNSEDLVGLAAKRKEESERLEKEKQRENERLNAILRATNDGIANQRAAWILSQKNAVQRQLDDPWYAKLGGVLAIIIGGPGLIFVLYAFGAVFFEIAGVAFGLLFLAGTGFWIYHYFGGIEEERERSLKRKAESLFPFKTIEDVHEEFSGSGLSGTEDARNYTEAEANKNDESRLEKLRNWRYQEKIESQQEAKLLKERLAEFYRKTKDQKNERSFQDRASEYRRRLRDEQAVVLRDLYKESVAIGVINQNKANWLYFQTSETLIHERTGKTFEPHEYLWEDHSPVKGYKTKDKNTPFINWLDVEIVKLDKAALSKIIETHKEQEMDEKAFQGRSESYRQQRFAQSGDKQKEIGEKLILQGKLKNEAAQWLYISSLEALYHVPSDRVFEKGSFWWDGEGLIKGFCTQDSGYPFINKDDIEFVD